jgi:hypothetical protein
MKSCKKAKYSFAEHIVLHLDEWHLAYSVCTKHTGVPGIVTFIDKNIEPLIFYASLALPNN